MARTRYRDVQNFNDNLGLNAEQVRRRNAAKQAYIEQEMPDIPEAKFHIFKLTDDKRKGGYNLGSICDVLWKDKEGNQKIRRMRLLRGHPSFWVDEQKELTPEFIKTNHITTRFERGTARIPDAEKLQYEFLRYHGANIHAGTTYQTHKTTFYEWDSAAIAKKESELRGKRREALKIAAAQPLEQMRKHCLFLGITFLDEFGEAKSPEALRNDYEDYADLNPEIFIESNGSKEMEITYLVKKAIKEGFIEVGRTPNSVHFTNGGLICKVPPNTKPVKALVDMALYNNEESKVFLEQLQALNIK
jgi:hypothetical protein